MKLEMQAKVLREGKASLEKDLEEVQLSCAAGQADVAALKRDLSALEAKVCPCKPRFGPCACLSLSCPSFLPAVRQPCL